MSWGYKIAALYAGFVILIITMVSLTMREKIDLVSKDYYDQELKFQEKIDKVNRTRSLSESLSWQVNPDELILNFPKEFRGQKISGTIYFFRPSDASMDQTIDISADTTLIKNIPTGQMKSGLYKIQVSWQAEEKEFYNEGIIQLK